METKVVNATHKVRIELEFEVEVNALTPLNWHLVALYLLQRGEEYGLPHERTVASYDVVDLADGLIKHMGVL